jgi:aspartate racemase
MKTIGLLGGMSWESSIEYYRIINQEIKKRLGGTHSAKIIMNSLNFQEVENLQHRNKWDDLTRLMIEESKKLVIAGADVLVICTNTMHKMADDIEKAISIPILHIADATAQKIIDLNLTSIGLLGTKFTMEMNFYRGRLEEKYDLSILIPNEEDRAVVHQVIYSELVQGIIKNTSKSKYLEIIERFEEKGIEGLILGCTEIGLLINSSDVKVPVFDTTNIHAMAAVNFALS